MVRFCGMRALAHQQRHAHTRTDCDATPALDVDGNTIALSTWNVIALTAVIVTLQRLAAGSSCAAGSDDAQNGCTRGE